MERVQSPNPVVGAWRLVAFEVRHPGGRVVYPFGENPKGFVVLTESGWFTVQLMSPDRPQIASGDQLTGTPEETIANYQGYSAYYGRYDVDLKEQCVNLHVEGSLFPNWEGGTNKRFFRIEGNRIRFTTPPTTWGGEGIVGLLEWERAD
jgi:hypothetical protein